MERDEGGMPYRNNPLNRRVYAVPDNVPSQGQVPRRSDEDIKRDVETVLFYDSAVSSLGLKVHVHEGIVTITGNIDSALASRIAFEDAAKVPGVREVRDELNVTSTTTPRRAAGQDMTTPKPNEPIYGQPPQQPGQTPTSGQATQSSASRQPSQGRAGGQSTSG